jgi:hypothetical protein
MQAIVQNGYGSPTELALETFEQAAASPSASEVHHE